MLSPFCNIISLQTTSGYIFLPLHLIVLMFQIPNTHLTEKRKPSACRGMCFDRRQTHRSQKSLTANRHHHLCGRCVCVFVSEWSAGDYRSNDNSTYGGWINLPERWDHKSNLRMIILLPDEELIPNVVQWSARRWCFAAPSHVMGGMCMLYFELGFLCSFLWFITLSIALCISNDGQFTYVSFAFHWIHTEARVFIPAAYIVCIGASGVFSPLSVFLLCAVTLH